MYSREEKIANIKELRPLDDIFFETLARKKEVCQEILRTIIGDKELIVEEVVPQASIKNLYGRSVRLDALCVLGDGTKCNIEVQRSNNDDHVKRVRFNASSITVKESNPGEDFSDVIELYVVYISEFDIFGYGRTTYHVDKVIRENNELVDDGLHEIYVNTAINDGSEISELMECFLQKKITNPKFPELAKEVNNLKNTEGGVGLMCEIMEKMFEEERKAYEKMMAEKDAAMAEKDATMAEKDAEIARLKAQLAAANS